MKTIYLDNNATSQVAPEVLEAMFPYFHELYGNPSSMHSFGGQVSKTIRDAREKVATLIGADPEEDHIYQLRHGERQYSHPVCPGSQS